MPKFDYNAAKEAGYSDDEIAAYLRERRAAGEDVYIDRQEYHNPLSDVARLARETGAADVVGKAFRVAGSALSWPKAMVLRQVLEPEAPIPPFSPTASYDILKRHPLPNRDSPWAPLTSPMALDIATDLPMAVGYNAVGKQAMRGLSALSDIPIAGGKSIRQMPGVKQALEFNTPGASLPKSMRAETQGILRTAEGEANLAGYQRERALGGFLNLPVETQDRIGTAIELRKVDQLVPEERAVAEALQSEYAARPAARAATSLRKHELGAHIDEAEELAQALRREADLARRYYEQFKEARIEAPSIIDMGESGVPLPSLERMSGDRRKSFAKMPSKEAQAMVGQPPQRGMARSRGERAALMGTPITGGPKQIPYRHETLAPPLRFVTRAEKMAARKERAAVRAEQRALELSRGVPSESRVSFIDRPLPPEARKEAKLKSFGTAAPGGLGTGRLGRRISDPSKTTAQINAELEAEGKERIAPVVKAAFMAGEANDLRVMHGKIIKNLADKYGVPTKNPGESIAKMHESVATGFTDDYRRVLESKKFPKEIDELVTRLNERLKPEQFEQTTRAWRAVNSEFKKYALFSPGFVSRNLQNNFFQTAVFGNVYPGTWIDATKVRAAMSTGKHLDDMISVGKTRMRVGDYIEDAFRRRVLSGGQTAQEIGKSGIPGIGHAQRAFRWTNEAQENISRMAFDLYNMRHGGLNAMKSAERVDQVLFNYSNRLQHPVKAYARRNAIPFINWSSQIGPLTARSFIERPGSMGMVGSQMARMNKDAGFERPEDIAKLGPDVVEGGGVVTKKLPDNQYEVTVPQMIGQYSVNELIPNKAEPQSVFDTITRNMYPQFSVTYGIAANRDPLSGKPLTRGGMDLPMTAPAALKSIFLMPGGREWADKHNIIVTKDGTVKAPARIALLLRSIPHARIPSIMADAISPGKNSETRLKSYLYGIRQVTRNPEEGEAIQTGIERSKERDRQSAGRAWMRVRNQ